MEIVLALLSFILSGVAIVCWLIVLIDAFQDSVLKGFACLLCGFYWLYYAVADFEHENKWLIVLGAFAGAIGRGLFVAYAR